MGGFWYSISLSVLAGLSTPLGAIPVVLLGIPTSRTMGLLVSFAAGVMLYLSLLDLMPDVLHTLDAFSSIAAFVSGTISFIAIHHFVPDSNPMLTRLLSSSSSSASSSSVVQLEKQNSVSSSQPSPPPPASSASSKGLLLVPSKQRPGVISKSALLILIALSLHNLPEGMAVFLTSSSSTSSSLSPLRLVAAIAMHNVPEGVALAAPVYASTRSVRAVMIATFLSGLCEPLGAAVLGGLISVSSVFGTSAEDPLWMADAVWAALGWVSGMMAAVSVELMREASGYAGSKVVAIGTLAGGFATAALHTVAESIA
eukprot:ANDGO_01889.mRNA.1 Zinc transporter ZTP29